MIIGKLIPAGTGMECYRDLEVKRTQPYNDPVLAELEMAAKASESRRAQEDDDDPVADDELPADGAGDADDTVDPESDTPDGDVGDDDLLTPDDEDKK